MSDLVDHDPIGEITEIDDLREFARDAAAEITRLRVALAGRCLGEDRYRSAASKALHILRHCPDKQEKAEAILAAELEKKP